MRRESATRLAKAAMLSAGLALGAGAASAAERAIIVLDASGSMWGQIEGTAKIEIARRTLARVLGDLPEDLELGLIAYGHRQKGQCTDIELVVPAGRGTAAAISDAVKGINPRGKTPLTASVKMAAEALKYTEDKATVILITDGLETCDADPCALARSLEELGVDFTAHVVGFGLSDEEGREVACLAEETGGVYIPAGDEAELIEAMERTVIAPPEVAATPEPEPDPAPEPAARASLTAPDAADILAPVTVGWDGPGARGDRIELWDPDALGGEGRRWRNLAVDRGDMDAKTVRMDMPARAGAYELRYVHEGEVIATRPITAAEVEVSLSAESPSPAARPIVVTWEGPGARYDEVQLWDPDALGGEGRRLHAKRLRNDDYDGRKVTLPGPAEPGTYELRYWTGTDRQVLATLALEISEIEVSLDAPEAIEAARPIVVTWKGPGARYDEVQLWDPDALGGEGRRLHTKRLRNDDYDGRKVTLPGPAEAGTYELRYWNGDNRTVMATATIVVRPAEVSLTAPESLPAGRVIEVSWEGPGARYDEVQLWDPDARGGEGRKVQSKRLRNDDYDGRKVTLPGPAEPGTYELRYWNGDNRTVMATATIEITEIAVSLSAPDSVEAGRTFDVTWDGPGARYDEVQLWDPAARGGEGQKLHSRRLRNADYDARRLSLPAPSEPGTYELRYWYGDGRKVMATQSVEIVPIEMALDAPDAVEPETRFAVTWQGPGGRYDEVQIVDPASGKAVAKRRLRSGDLDARKVTLTAPKAPGDYVLRYWHGENRAVMHEVPLSVN